MLIYYDAMIQCPLLLCINFLNSMSTELQNVNNYSTGCDNGLGWEDNDDTRKHQSSQQRLQKDNGDKRKNEAGGL